MTVEKEVVRTPARTTTVRAKPVKRSTSTVTRPATVAETTTTTVTTAPQ